MLDLRAHQEEWVRDKLGDRALGFGDDELRRMLTAAGLSDVKVGVGARKAGDPFTVLIAAGEAGASAKTRRHEMKRTPMKPDVRHNSTRCSHADPRARRRDGDDDPAPQADRGRLPRRAVQGSSARSRGNNDLLIADAARRHRRDPPPVPRGRRRHHRDQHLQQHADRAGRLRSRALGLRAERRGRAARQGRLRRVDGADARPAALRGRLDGADQPDAVDLARRQQPGVPGDDLRRAARRLRGAGRAA